MRDWPDVSRIERISEDVLVLPTSYQSTGGVSWLPAGARGLEPYNAYVVLSDDRALLIDTGVALHEDSLLQTLREVIGSRQLVVFITRIELDNLGNLGRIVEVFPGVQVTTSNVVPLFKLVHISDDIPPPLPARRILIGNTLAEFGFPRIHIYEALIRTLGSTWLWDKNTQTLFTTGIFSRSHAEQPDQSNSSAGQSWLAESNCHARRFILGKFDWLALADTTPLLARWNKFFSEIHPPCSPQFAAGSRSAVPSWQLTLRPIEKPPSNTTIPNHNAPRRGFWSAKFDASAHNV